MKFSHFLSSFPRESEREGEKQRMNGEFQSKNIKCESYAKYHNTKNDKAKLCDSYYTTWSIIETFFCRLILSNNE